MADFELLMRRHNQTLFRTARAILRHDGEAEDVVQESYLRAYTQLEQLQDDCNFGAWTSRIVVNLALSRRRTGERRGESTLVGADNVVALPSRRKDPEEQAVVSELRELLEAAIDELPDGTREVLVLRDVEGLSTNEVADRLGIGESAAKVRLHRGRQAMRTHLEREMGGAIHEVFAFAGDRCDRIVRGVLARLETGGS